jgi:hypothetical protein
MTPLFLILHGVSGATNFTDLLLKWSAMRW